MISQLERLQESQSQVSSLEKQTESLEREILKLQVKVTGFGRHEQRLGELARDTTVNRKIYEDLAERHQLARVTGALGKAEESERIKLIDPPFTPLAPSNLPVLIFIILGGVSGIFLGLGLAIVAEILDLTIRHRQQLEGIIGVPVLTRLPQLPANGLTPQDGNINLVLCGKTGSLIPMETAHA